MALRASGEASQRPVSAAPKINDDIAIGLENVVHWEKDVKPSSASASRDEHFFKDIEEIEWQPVSVACTTRTHPDTLLRRLGVIECRGTAGNERAIFFEARTGQWVFEDTLKPVGKKHEETEDRYDKLPKGVISVVGDLDGLLRAAASQSHGLPYHTQFAATVGSDSDGQLRDLIDHGTSYRNTELIKKIKAETQRKVEEATREERRRLAQTSRAKASKSGKASVEVDNVDVDSGRDTPSSSSDADTVRRIRPKKAGARKQKQEEALPNAEESLKVIQQYLTRGVVDAARRTESCIVSRGDTKIALHLAAGVDSKQDKGVAKGRHVTEIRPSKTLLVGISPYGSDLLGDSALTEARRLNQYFTHHVVIERCTAPAQDAGDFDSPYIINPVQELKMDGMYAQARVAKKATEKLPAKQGGLLEMVGVGRRGRYRACTGFKCSHVDNDGVPIVEDDGSPRHCRMTDVKGGVTFNDDSSSEGYDANADDASQASSEMVTELSEEEEVVPVQNTNRMLSPEEQEEQRIKTLQRKRRMAREKESDSRFVQSLGAAWDHCRRVCECGHQMGPFDIAKCVCGRYDFQHVPRVVKRNRQRILAKFIKDSSYLMFASFIGCPIAREPSQCELHAYTIDILSVLSKGFHPDTDKNKWMKTAPPRRQGVPVVSVLFGGSHFEKFRLIRHVQKRWPLLVVEGSGGYADVLCSIIGKVRDIVHADFEAKGGRAVGGQGDKAAGPSQAGLDEYRKFLSGIDSTTAEIIINGHVQLIAKGAKTNEFSRKIENSLNGNETLEKAWLLYAAWGYNAVLQRRLYFWFNLVIVVLGVLTTAASVSQTFVLLVYEDDAPPDMARQKPLWLGLQWSVITLPIVSTLFQAIANKYAPGPKWVRLHHASERLLSEIYKYRTGTLEYSATGGRGPLNAGGDDSGSDGTKAAATAATVSAASAAASGVPEDDEAGKAEEPKERSGLAPPTDTAHLQATSKEELLQARCHMLTDFLSESDVANVTLKPYEGSLPPKNIKRNGDDGFSSLGPDQYRKVRLETKIAALEKRALAESRTIFVAVFSVNAFNATGTMLASLAAYGLGYMQAWVSLTAALSAAVTRWLDFSRLVYLNSKLNVSINNLGSVSVWWAGQGANADNREDRDRLVEDTELHILEETLLWGKVIQGQGVVEKGENNDGKGPPKKGPGEGQKLKELGQKHGIELEDLAPAKLFEALEKPDGSNGKGVRESLKKLAQLGLAPPTAAAALARDRATAASSNRPGPTEPTATDDADKGEGATAAAVASASARSPISRGPITKELLEVLRFAPTRNHLLTLFLRANGKSKEINAWSIHHICRAFPQVYPHVKEMRSRDLLEIVKALCVEALMDYFLDDRHFEGVERYKKVTVQLHDVVQCTHVVDELFIEECFLSELRVLGRMESVENLDANGLVNCFKDPQLKAAVRKLHPGVKSVLRREAMAVFRFPANDRAMTPENSIAMMLEDVAESIALLDVDDFLQNFDTRVRLWSESPLASVLGEAEVQTLSKRQMVRDLPLTISKNLVDKSPLQIQKYFAQFARGTEAARVFRQVHQKFDAQLDPYYTKGRVFHPRGDLELRERIVLSVHLIDQITINRQSRGLLIRKLKICPVYSAEMDELFTRMREPDFKFLLSTIQARLNNTYASRMLDRAADEINTFDCRKTIPTTEAAKLICRLKGFQKMQLDAVDTRTQKEYANDNDLLRATYSGFSVMSLTKKQIFNMLDFRSLITRLKPLSEEQLKELCVVLIGLSGRSYPLLVFSKIREDMQELTIPQLNDVVKDWDPEFIDGLIYTCWNSSKAIKDLAKVPQATRANVPSDDVIDLISSNMEAAEGLTALRNAGREAGLEDTVLSNILTTLLAKVVDLGGDRTLSVSFECAGISCGQPGVIQREFSTPADRREFAELVMTLPTLEPHILFLEEDGKSLKSADRLFDELFCEGDQVNNIEKFPVSFSALSTLKAQDEKQFLAILAHLIIELTLEFPLRMFHNLASNISMFDVRDIFTGYDCRRSFFLYIFEFFFMEGAVSNPLDTIQCDHLAQAEAWMGRKIGNVPVDGLPSTTLQTVQKFPPGKWRLQMLKELSARAADGGGEYAALLESVRVLTEVQLKVLVEEACSLVSTTTAGRVFLVYMRTARARVPEAKMWCRWLQHNSVVDVLRQRSKMTPDFLAKQFENYNAEAFFAGYIETRERALSHLLFTDASKQLIHDMYPAVLEREIFTYLKTFAPLPRTMYAKATRQFRNENWKKLVNKTEVMSSLLDPHLLPKILSASTTQAKKQGQVGGALV